MCEQDSSEWINIIDRGGLWFVSDCTYIVFYAMEEEIRLHLIRIRGQETVNLKTVVCSIMKNVDVLFYWSMASASFEEGKSNIVLDKIVKLWVTVRGFAFTSGWIELYKLLKKTTTQKKKPLRESLQ